MKRIVLAAVCLAVFPGAAPAAAADKVHQQLMAEIRMLQEQQQQLQQMIGGLAETLKTISARIDDQSGATRKGFADQKVIVDGIAEGVRVLREKGDDTNVRLASITQELQSLRQAISTMSVPGVAPVTGTGEQTPAPAGTVSLPPSAEKTYDAAFNDYTGGQYDLAIAGFEFYLKSFPTSPRAGEAQLNIGNSYYALGNYQQAVAAFQRVISDYPQSTAVPTAYYKLGLTYEAMKQPELARRAYETVIKNHLGTPDAVLAKQRLDSLNRKGE